MRVTALHCATLVGCASAASVRGSLSIPSGFDGSVVLNSQASTLEALVDASGHFAFHEVPKGGYLLEVYDTQRAWPTAWVRVHDDDAVDATLTHTKRALGSHPTLEPLLDKLEFFEKVEGFKLSSIFMNPMVLMMGVMLLLMFIMPRMMANMDPEELAAMQESMKTQGIAGMLSDPQLQKVVDKADERSRSEERGGASGKTKK